MEPEGSIPNSQKLSTCSYPEATVQVLGLCIIYHNKYIFYREGLLAQLPTSNTENHPLSLVRECLFNIYLATLLV
jgi:hypothetical protein